MWIAIAIIVLILLWIVFAYNGLVVLKNRTDESWSDIDVQLKRRHDLIPNLVETVKGYAAHEKEVFEKVTQARAAALSAQSIEDKARTENALSDTLKSLFAVSEAYPELKASDNFRDLQAQLTDTEDKIQAARRFYNGNVRDLNTKIESFPTNLIAGMLGYAKRTFFEAAEGEREPVAVKF